MLRTKKWLGAPPKLARRETVSFLYCKLAVTSDRMCSPSRLTVLQFSSAAHQKYFSLSCFSSVYRPFFISFFVDFVLRLPYKYISTFSCFWNDLVATPNHPLLLPPSALPKKAAWYNVFDYIIQTGTRKCQFTCSKHALASSWCNFGKGLTWSD